MSLRNVQHGEAITRLRGFAPTGDETVDVETLYDLIDQLGQLKHRVEVRRELIMILERNPDVDLGSPGPIVHTLEESPIDDHVVLLAESLQRRATIMTVWMAERCLRSNLSDRNRHTVVDALRSAAEINSGGEIALSIEEALREYGT
jgi:hypothetical protein